MKLKICLMGFLCLFFKVNAQFYHTIRPLNIGDSIPNLVFDNLVNYNHSTLNLSDFKNKLIILDFWSTSCGSCIAMFPKEVDLQQKFKDKIEFLLVDCKNTKDDKSKILRFFEAYHPSYKELTSIVEDTVLSQYFPHRAVGYYVWIKNGIVQAITEDQDYNLKNIEDFLNGKHPNLDTVKFIEYDATQLTYLNNNGGAAPGYIYRSILTPYKEGLPTPSRFIYDPNGSCTGYSSLNDTRFNLYGVAYPDFGLADANRVLIQVERPETFSLDSSSAAWKTRNLFTYETTFPPRSKTEAIKYIRTELNQYFHYRIDTVYRDTPCYILTSGKFRKHSNIKLKPLNSDSKSESFLRDYPIASFVHELNAKSKIPFIDESNYTGTIRMTYNYVDLSQDEILNKLRSEGLIIEKAIRRVKFWVISDAPAY